MFDPNPLHIEYLESIGFTRGVDDNWLEFDRFGYLIYCRINMHDGIKVSCCVRYNLNSGQYWVNFMKVGGHKSSKTRSKRIHIEGDKGYVLFKRNRVIKKTLDNG